jgi:PAS domain S-box-containing protein
LAGIAARAGVKDALMAAQGSPPILLVAAPENGAADLVAALRQEGFAVRQAATGADGLRQARDGPRLVLLGPHLPDLGPAEVFRLLRDDPATSFVPVLQLGDETPGGPSAEADAYLPATARPPEVLAQVRGLLRLRRVEDALRASEARLQYILDRAPVAVFVKDTQGRYLLVNRHWEQCFGLSRASVTGRPLEEVHPPERAAALRANDRCVLEAGGPLEFEEEVPGPAGPRTYLSVKFPLAGADGTPYAVCGISTDITERKNWEKALHDSEALYHSLVETLPVSIVRKDCQGRYTFANRSFCAALGRTAAEVIGRTALDFYEQETAHRYLNRDRQVMETGEVYEAVEERAAADGSRAWVQAIKSPLRDSAGRVIGVQGVFWDITARRRAEQELGRAAAEFRVARQIQQRLYPAAPPRLEGMEVGGASFGFDIGGASYPAEAVGGDYFDYIALRDGTLGVAVGDVSGHGLGPALLMAEVRAYLRAFAQTGADVRAVLGLLNRVIGHDIEGDRFVTLLLARVDPRARTLTYASAGHPVGYLFDAQGTLKRSLRSTAIPLGILPEVDYPASEPIPLEDGDIVLLVTDGVVEARAPDGSAFGPGRVQDLLRFYRRAPARELVENLYHAVRAFTQYQPQVDDITATVIKVAPA